MPRLVSFLGCLVAFVVAPATALADHHEIRIREVSAGTVAAPKAEYVELQMLSPNQNVFVTNNASIALFDATGSQVVSALLTDHNPVNDGSQDYVLVGSATANTTFGVTADYALPDLDNVSGAGGAACFRSNAFGTIDCVSWGNFNNVFSLPTGGNVDPSGIPDGQVIRRTTARGCPLLLESADDTNNPADWANATADPHANSPASTPGVCPQTSITKKPKKRSTDRTPTFKFVSDPAGPAFECKLDGGDFEPCDSPHATGRLKLGKHRFRVQAENDPTAASYSWKIVKRR
jgi:hypothetical protein